MTATGGRAPADDPGGNAAWPAASRPRALGLLKLAVTASLYLIVFYRIRLDGLLARLSSAHLEYVAAAVALYAAGQAVSAYKWHLLMRPAGLTLRYGRVLSMYFIGMFFNIFLPTIVGGDAVKAVLLARATRSPARATISVFMERNTGLLALLTIATAAAWWAPRVRLFGLSLFAIAVLLSVAFLVVNAAMFRVRGYAIVDRLLARLAPARFGRFRPRAMSLYDALLPYTHAIPTLAAAVALSFVFQCVVILVVFLNTRALDQPFPVSALAVCVPLISLAGMIPISVNGLGVREALYLVLFSQLGAPPEVAVLLALLYFAVTLAASLPGGIVYALQRQGSAQAAGALDSPDGEPARELPQ